MESKNSFGQKIFYVFESIKEVILIPIFDDLDIQCSDGFIAELEARALKSKTCKLIWLDCLV